jgi:hypothetical protein
MQEKIEVPDGYKKDARGHLVPIGLIKPIDLARDELVRELVDAAKKLSAHMAEFKRRAFLDVEAFVSMSAEEYKAKVGGTKGNITLPTFDGQYKLQIAKADNITFDERLQAAKELIDECINEWSKGSRPEIQVLVQQAFETDKEGTINTGRVLALRRLGIEDEKWQSAMKAIGESVQVTGTKTYIRLYEREEGNDYLAIPLDISSI